MPDQPNIMDTHRPKVPVASNRPTFIILGILLIILILLGAYYFLQREGKSRSNPTDGHTALLLDSVPA
ncbi:MAG TPA: hypothetical protein VGL89_03405 [Candidatus Koribacter sp.]|jgi:hypothetical protein